jgi:gas vesicle protein
MSKDYLPGTTLTFILGVGIGATVALLLAPKSGEELRGDIADGVSDGVKQFRETSKDLERRATNLLGSAKDRVQHALEAGGKAYRQAKQA